MTGTRIHHIWQAMNARCTNPKRAKYEYYGGKGIRVCKEWQSFVPFVKWAKANGYTDELTIDRIDPKGNYCPTNCRWTTWKVQKRNTSSAKMLTAFGETKCIAEWAEDPRCVVSHATVRSRIIYGWCDEEAISVPLIARNQTRASRADRRNLTK